jgi:hypothetical protein
MAHAALGTSHGPQGQDFPHQGITALREKNKAGVGQLGGSLRPS